MLLCLIIAVISGFIGAWLGRRSEPAGDGAVQIDSVKTQIDTSMAVAPEPTETRPRDTIYIPVRNPVPKLPENVPDFPESVPELPENVPELPDSTIYIPVALEQKVYEDPDSTYRAVISGPAIDKYGPKLDTITVYGKREIVYQTKAVYVEPSRWSVGIQAGYGASKDGLTPYVGIGIQYRLWSPKKHKKVK